MVPSAPASAEDFPSALVKFALPSGSLQDATVDLFARASFDIRFTSRDYFPEVDDPDLGLISFRAQEVSRYVEAGVADAGITGRDWIVENGNAGAFDVRPSDKVVQVAELKYSKATSRPARWVLAVPEDSPINSAEDCEGLTIATELPETTKQYFAERGINCNVEYSWGTTEVKAKGLLVDGIVDITETGSSLRANNLRIVLTIMESTTRLIANKAAWAVPEKREKIKAIAMLLRECCIPRPLRFSAHHSVSVTFCHCENAMICPRRGGDRRQRQGGLEGEHSQAALRHVSQSAAVRDCADCCQPGQLRIHFRGGGVHGGAGTRSLSQAPPAGRQGNSDVSTRNNHLLIGCVPEKIPAKNRKESLRLGHNATQRLLIKAVNRGVLNSFMQVLMSHRNLSS